MEVSRASLAQKAPPFAKAVQGSGSIRSGLLYQVAVSEKLELLYGFQLLPSPWFTYDEGKLASPDALVIELHRGIIHIIEVKRRHTSAAFTQMRNKYLPILRAAFCWNSPRVEKRGGVALVGATPPWIFTLTEIAPAYDCRDSGGERVKLIRKLSEAQPSTEGVNFWSFPNRERKWW